MHALGSIGVDVAPIDGRPIRLVLATAKVAHGLQGFADEWRRGSMVTTASRIKVAAALRRSGASGVLYVGGLGILGVPGWLDDAKLPRFVLCDSTFLSRQLQLLQPRGQRCAVRERLAENERSAIRAMTHVFCVSKCAVDDIVRQYGVGAARVTATGTGIGAIRPYHGPKDYSNGRILFVAQQRAAEKGVTLLLQAFELVHAANAMATLTIVGGGFRPLEIERMPAGVRVLPRVDVRTLQGLFEAASLFAMPAIWEPWGLVYLESLLCRTPVLGLRRNALPEITADGRFGFLVDKADPRPIASEILRALAHPELLASMGIQGQRHVTSTYTWAAMAERMSSIMSPYLRP
jgi:glycosyltransferase involved in cell wall biosynthesis